MNQNFDITIIGGSFAGMTTALAISNVAPQLKIAIVEKEDILNNNRQRDGRAYAISSLSLQLFKEIGIFEQLNAKAGQISDIQITDHKSPFILDFLGAEVGGNLGQIIENYHIHNALRDKILTHKNIKVFAPNFYEEINFDNEVRVKLDNNLLLNSKLLLACDGRFSKLRQIYNISATTKKYYQTAIVFSIKHQLPHNNVAHEKFLPGGPLAILPFRDQNQSSIVWIAKDQEAKAINDLDDKNFKHQLNKKMANILGDISEVSSKFSYPLTLIEADKFIHQKMLLIGDAATGIHPIAGQGFNLAVANINILCRLLKNNLDSGLDISNQNLIESYNKKAKFNAKKMIVATDILNSLFETKNLPIAIARDIGLGLVNRVPKLKNFFIKAAGGF